MSWRGRDETRQGKTDRHRGAAGSGEPVPGRGCQPRSRAVPSIAVMTRPLVSPAVLFPGDAAPPASPRCPIVRAPPEHRQWLASLKAGQATFIVSVLSPAKRNRNAKLSEARRERHVRSVTVGCGWGESPAGTAATRRWPLPAALGRPAAPGQRTPAGRELTSRENLNPLEVLNGSGRMKTTLWGAELPQKKSFEREEGPENVRLEMD